MYDSTVKQHHNELEARSTALKKQEEKWIAEMTALKEAHSAEQERMRADGIKARQIFEKTLNENKLEHFAELTRLTNEKDAVITDLTNRMN